MHTQGSSEFAELAAFLSKERDAVVQEWISAVRRDRTIATAENLTVRQLRDHMPEVFDRLALVLGASEEPNVEREFEENARAHGQHRWEQGYDLTELLHELTLVRRILLGRVTEFARQTESFSRAQKRQAKERVHSLLDEIAAASAEQFVDDQQAELRRQAAALEEARTALQQGNERLRETDESRLQLLRTVAHELRNMLNATKLFGATLIDDEEAEVRRRVGVMLNRNVDHMSELLDDLLDLSTLIAGQNRAKMNAFVPKHLLHELVLSYESLAEEKGLQFEAMCDPALKKVTGDELKVKQIASNLLSNAVKYTGTGKVRLEFARVDDRCWMIRVEDTGVGIAADEQQRIFGEFHRSASTEHHRGTGLGLAITKRLVDLLGGEIELRSTPGEGSSFTIKLPIGQAINA